MDPWDQWQSAWAERSKELTRRGLHRRLGTHPEARFGHNDYLGLRRDPRIRQGLIEDLQAGISTTSSGSRLLSGNAPSFERFESDFAQSAGRTAGLVFASASEANRAAICALVHRHDTVIHDELAHASLIDGILHSQAHRRKFAHNDPSDLRAQLKSCPGKLRLVVTESLFSMDGDIAPLAEILLVCEEEGALLLVDEVHATGLFGPHRTGLCEALSPSPALVATTHGLGKALASAGGMLCGPSALIESILNTSRPYIFTTAPSPLAIRAGELAWGISRTDTARREHLENLCTVFSQELITQGWSLPRQAVQSPIFPLLTGGLSAAQGLSEHLGRRGIHLRPIRPPTVPPGTERLRATITADLTTADLFEFLEALRDF